MTDYTTKTLAELRRDWCERVGTVHENIGWASVGGVDFPLRLRKGWALAGLVLDEMARRGFRWQVVETRNVVIDDPKDRWFLGEGPAIDRAALIASLRALDAEEEAK